MTHSLDLFHASERLRAFVHRKALEDLFGAPEAGRVARSIEWENERAKGGTRYRSRVDLRVPAPRMHRPTTADGRTTTHVRIEVARKVAAPASVPGKGTLGNGATAYSNYVMDPAKVGDIAYLTDAKTEAGPGIGEHRVAAFASNIGNDRETLGAYWNDRWEAGRKTGEPRLELFPDRGSIEDWRALADARDTPPHIARTALRIATLREAGRLPKCRLVRSLNEDVLFWGQRLGTRFGDKKDKRILHFAKPRAARIQIKIVFEFDERLTAAERQRVLRDLMICLDSQGVRMLAIAHDPDANNDRRNFHAHVLIDPTVYPVEDDRTTGTKGRKMRPGQLASILGYLPMEPPEAHHQLIKLDHRAVRQFVVSAGNDQLAKRGLKPRFHAGSFAELCIPKNPNVHLGSSAATLVAVGALVERDYQNAVDDWRFAIAQLEADLKRQEGGWTRFRTQVLADAAPLTGKELDDLDVHLARHQHLAAASADQARQLAQFDLLQEIARSAAERLKRKTGRIVDNLDEGGKVTAADRKNQVQLRARHALAAMHLGEIEAALAPYEPAIAAERTQLATRLQELADLELEARQRLKSGRVAAGRRAWVETSVVAGEACRDPLAPEAHFQALVAHIHGQLASDSTVRQADMVYAFRDAGTQELRATGLRSADVALISDARFARRWAGVLSEAEKHQRTGISRLAKFVEANGRNRLVLGISGNGKALPSTLERLRDRLAGHPLLGPALHAAERRHQAAGDNDHYLRLDAQSSKVEPPADRPVVAATAGTRPATSHRDPAPDHAAVRPATPSAPASPAAVQPNIANEPSAATPAATIVAAAPAPAPDLEASATQVRALDADRFKRRTEPQVTPASTTSDRELGKLPENEGQAVAAPVEPAQPIPEQRPEVRHGDEQPAKQIQRTWIPSSDPPPLLPPSEAPSAEQQARDQHSSAPLSPADGPETVPPVATPNPAQQHRLGQAGVIDMADRPDTGAMAPSAVDVDALQGLIPRIPDFPASAEPPRAKDKAVSPTAPETTSNEPPMASRTATAGQEWLARRKDTPTEKLRNRLRNAQPRSTTSRDTGSPSPPPKSPERSGKASSTAPARKPSPPPGRSDKVDAVRRLHQERWSKAATGTTYKDFERSAAQFVVPIREGVLSIRMTGGDVQVGGILSDGYHEDLRRFARTPIGWVLLAQLALQLNDENLPTRHAQWTAVPRPLSIPDDWMRQLRMRAPGPGRSR